MTSTVPARIRAAAILALTALAALQMTAQADARDSGTVSVGGYQACAVTADTAVACWPEAPESSAIDDPPAGGIARIVTGDTMNVNCAITTDSAAACWGFDGGAGGERVRDEVPADLGPITDLTVSDFMVTAVTADGRVVAWQGDTSMAVPTGLGPVKQVSASPMGLTCVVKADGTPACWDYTHAPGDPGDPADEDFGTRPRPLRALPASAPDTVTELAVNDMTTCAVVPDRTVECWLNPGVDPGEADEVGVPASLGQVKTLRPGRHLSTCAITVDDEPMCWYWDGSLVDIPAYVTTVRDISAYGSAFCAVTAAATVKCWADRGSGSEAIVAGVPVGLEPSQRDPFAPYFRFEPEISGLPYPGAMLTCGSWQALGADATSVTWLRDGQGIASGEKYRLVKKDIGRAITCRVTATGASGATTVESEAVTPAAAPTAVPCPKVVVVGLRGSDEWPGGKPAWFGTPGRAFANHLSVALAGNPGAAWAKSKVVMYGLPYLAVSVGYALTVPHSYGISMRGGADALLAYLRTAYTEDCAGVKFVLFGYSQGAHAIGETLSSPDFTPALQRRVLAVVLFGDPMFNAGEDRFERPGGHDRNTSIAGILGRRPAGAFRGARSVYPVQSYCHGGDTVCQGRLIGPVGEYLNPATWWPNHENYHQGDHQRAADWVAQQIRTRIAR